MNFEQVRERAESGCDFLKNETLTRIYISTADTAAGTGILRSVTDEINRQGLNAKVIAAGSTGYYHLEPIMRTEKPGKPAVLYTNVSPGEAASIVNEYVGNDNPLPEKVLCSEGDGRIRGIPDASEIPLISLQERIVLKNCGPIDPGSIEQYIVRGQGYAGLSTALGTTPAEVIDEIGKSGLRGRGGAGFATGDKWQICRDAEGDEKYVICNAVDADPDSRAARLIMESDPHSVLEGLLIAAYAVGASRCFLCVNAAYEQGIERLTEAVNQAEEFNLSGNNILDTGFSVEIEIKETEDSPVAGEETALIRAVEGKQAMPYVRTVYPAVSGINGKPTLVNSLETLAAVPAILRNGAEWYSGFGTDQSKGTKVVTLAGSVNNRCTVEIPFGTTIQTLISEIGGVPDDKVIKAVQFGGVTGAYFGVESLNTAIDYEKIREAGYVIGSGVAVVYDDSRCGVEMVKDTVDYLQKQSCGKCVFCREGLIQIQDILEDISENKAQPGDLELLSELCELMQTGSICGFGSNAANPVLSSIKLFGNDYETHITEKRCPADSK